MEEKFRKYAEILLEKQSERYKVNNVIDDVLAIDNVSKIVDALRTSNKKISVDMGLGEVIQNLYNMASIVKEDLENKKNITDKEDAIESLVSICNLLTYKSYLKKIEEIASPLKDLKGNTDLADKTSEKLGNEKEKKVLEVSQNDSRGPNNTIKRLLTNPESFFLKAVKSENETSDSEELNVANLNKIDNNLKNKLNIDSRDRKELRSKLRNEYGVTIAEDGTVKTNLPFLQKGLYDYFKNRDRNTAVGLMIINPNMFTIGEDGKIIYSQKSTTNIDGSPSADMFLVLPRNDKDVYNLYIYKKWQSVSSIPDIKKVILSDKGSNEGGKVAVLDGNKWNDPKGSAFLKHNKNASIKTWYYSNRSQDIKKLMNTNELNKAICDYSRTIKFLIVDGTEMPFHGTSETVGVDIKMGEPGQKTLIFNMPSDNNIFGYIFNRTGPYPRLKEESRKTWFAQLGNDPNNFKQIVYPVVFVSNIARPYINCDAKDANSKFIKFKNVKTNEEHIYEFRLKKERVATSTNIITKEVEKKSSVMIEEVTSGIFRDNFKKYFESMRKTISSLGGNGKFLKDALRYVNATEKYLIANDWKPASKKSLNTQYLDVDLKFIKSVGNSRIITNNASWKNINQKADIEQQAASIRTFDDIKNLDRKTLKARANNIRNRK